MSNKKLDYERMYKELADYIKKAHAPWEGGPQWRYWDGLDEAYSKIREKMAEIEAEV